jgi:hypothetical protein
MTIAARRSGMCTATNLVLFSRRADWRTAQRRTAHAKSLMPPIDCLPYRNARGEKAGGWRSFGY